MQTWIIRWILNIFAIILTATLLTGFEVTVAGAILGSVILGIINAVIRPLLIFFTLPLTILTLGLFTLVINGFTLWLTSLVIPGFDLLSFWWAVLSALVLSILSFIFSSLIK